MEVLDQPNFDLLNNLRSFLAGATRTSKCNDLELTRSGLALLKTLPASRDAVLEYFCMVFDLAVHKYSSQAQNDQLMNAPVPVSQQEEEVMGEIHGVLCSFVTARPEPWAPIVSTWSLQLLGRLSSRYSVLPGQVGLNETLHWWMSCKAARTLIAITTQCLHCLIDTDTEACVSALLDTSVAHSPHFDWVVALVGNCFSKTVITRILSLGLKDFCQKGNGGSSKCAKLKSVVGILGHLATGNFTDVRCALLELFMWGQNPGGNDDATKRAVVPYLLQLAAQSQILLNALATDVLQTLDAGTLNKMGSVASSWGAYLDDSGAQLEDLVVVLMLRCEKGGAKVVSLLLEGAASERPNVALTSQVLIELLLEEIDYQQRVSRNTPVPLLDSIKEEIGQLQPLLLTSDPMRKRTLCRLLKLIENVNPSVTTKAASYLLQEGTSATHMATLTMLVTPRHGGCANLLASALQQALLNSPLDTLWRNLTTLLKHKNNRSSPNGSVDVVANAVSENLAGLGAALASDAGQPSAVMQVLELLPPSCLAGLPLQLVLRLTSNTVHYFFTCLHNQEGPEKTIDCRRVCTVLGRLCGDSNAARSAALRKLLESGLFLSPAVLFGSRRRPIQRLADTPYSLTDQNYKLRTRSTLAGRQSSVFGNSVVLPNGNAQVNPTCSVTAEANMLHIIEALRSCCMAKTPADGILPLDAAIQVALLLVELISPDVMYNGLPWPEEDFCKVTIERDIHIRKVFDEVPVAWKLLESLAREQPALCYCSVLLRALMASLISQWSSPASSSQPAVLTTTVRLLRLMCMGQLLPPPLTSLQDIIPLVTPQEVLALLRGCVWNYMRDHVPSPALFSADPRSGFMWRDATSSQPPLSYTEPMRLVVLHNIGLFGPLYLNLFVHP